MQERQHRTSAHLVSALPKNHSGCHARPFDFAHVLIAKPVPTFP
jgi:hypothetical protein